jgi:NAD(P)H-flavin reductase
MAGVVPEGGLQRDILLVAIGRGVQELLSLSERLFEQPVDVVHVVRGQEAL